MIEFRHTTNLNLVSLLFFSLVFFLVGFLRKWDMYGEALCNDITNRNISSSQVKISFKQGTL